MATCDMTNECTNAVTHIGEKGYVYCAEHAPERRGYERTRRMRVWERKLIEAGEPLPSYRPVAKPKVDYGNTVHGEVARIHDEGMGWSEALAFCNID